MGLWERAQWGERWTVFISTYGRRGGSSPANGHRIHGGSAVRLPLENDCVCFLLCSDEGDKSYKRAPHAIERKGRAGRLQPTGRRREAYWTRLGRRACVVCFVFYIFIFIFWEI
jgi:hypothetical protein